MITILLRRKHPSTQIGFKFSFLHEPGKSRDQPIILYYKDINNFLKIIQNVLNLKISQLGISLKVTDTG